MKIYVVMKGIYSDRHVVTATVDPDKAKKIAEKFSDDWDDAWIDEFEDGDVMLKNLWYVRFNFKGEVETVELETDEHYYNKPDEVNRVHWNNYKYKLHDTWVYVFADDEEHAIKIATEKRAEFLAQRNGLI